MDHGFVIVSTLPRIGFAPCGSCFTQAAGVFVINGAVAPTLCIGTVATEIDEAFEKARKNLPPRVESSFLDTRARAFMALEMYDKAIADFRRAHLGRPENQNIIESLIECYRLNDLPTEAEVWSCGWGCSPENCVLHPAVSRSEQTPTRTRESGARCQIDMRNLE